MNQHTKFRFGYLWRIMGAHRRGDTEDAPVELARFTQAYGPRLWQAVVRPIDHAAWRVWAEYRTAAKRLIGPRHIP